MEQSKKEQPNLSHEELQQRLDAYGRIGEDIDQTFKMQAMKKAYLKEIKAKEDNRTKASIHYAQGQRAGLPQIHFEEIKEQYYKQDQKLRDNIANEAKAIYRETNSLSKSFKEGKSPSETLKDIFDKPKGKNMEMER